MDYNDSLELLRNESTKYVTKIMCRDFMNDGHALWYQESYSWNHNYDYEYNFFFVDEINKSYRLKKYYCPLWNPI